MTQEAPFQGRKRFSQTFLWLLQVSGFSGCVCLFVSFWRGLQQSSPRQTTYSVLSRCVSELVKLPTTPGHTCLIPSSCLKPREATICGLILLRHLVMEVLSVSLWGSWFPLMSSGDGGRVNPSTHCWRILTASGRTQAPHLGPSHSYLCHIDPLGNHRCGRLISFWIQRALGYHEGESSSGFPLRFYPLAKISQHLFLFKAPDLYLYVNWMPKFQRLRNLLNPPLHFPGAKKPESSTKKKAIFILPRVDFSLPTT